MEKMLQVRQMGRFNWIGLNTLIYKETARFLSVATQTVLGPVVTTMLYFAVFAVAVGGRGAATVPGETYFHFLAPGLIMMTMVQNAFQNTSSSLMIGKMQGNIVDVLMPPLSATELLIGYVTGAVIRGFMVGAACTLAVLPFVSLPVPDFGTLITFALLGNIMLATIGLVAGLWAQKFDHVAAVTNFIVTPLTFLSGTFYALAQLPPFWQNIAAINPFHHMIDGFRGAFLGTYETGFTLALVSLLLWNAVLLGGAWVLLHTGYRTRS